MADSLKRAGRHLLIAPRYGAKASCSKHLLYRVRPEVVIASNGCYGRYPSPHPGTLKRVKDFGASFYSTASHGCLKLVSDGHNWFVEPYLKEKRACQ